MSHAWKKALWRIPLLALLSGVLGVLPVLANPHQEAAGCRAQYALAAMPDPCWQVCVSCHAPLQPIQPLEIYQDGDDRICFECHPHETPTTPPRDNFLLYGVGTGGRNHPVNIYYAPETSRHDLRADPEGPRLYYDAAGSNPKLHCSTCHDPMSGNYRLLRLSNDGSALCLACHDI